MQNVGAESLNRPCFANSEDHGSVVRMGSKPVDKGGSGRRAHGCAGVAVFREQCRQHDLLRSLIRVLGRQITGLRTLAATGTIVVSWWSSG